MNNTKPGLVVALAMWVQRTFGEAMLRKARKECDAARVKLDQAVTHARRTWGMAAWYDPTHPEYEPHDARPGHFHVSRHDNDDAPMSTASPFGALAYAATELDRAADAKHDQAHGEAEAGFYQDAWYSARTARRLGESAAFAQHAVDQVQALPWERAPLYRADTPAERARTRPMLWDLALHKIDKLSTDHETGGLRIWPCDHATCEVDVDDE